MIITTCNYDTFLSDNYTSLKVYEEKEEKKSKLNKTKLNQ